MRKRSTAAFKAWVVQELLKEEKSLALLAAEYGVHPTQLIKWCAIALQGLPILFEGHDDTTALKAAHEQQLNALYAEIGCLTTQVAWQPVHRRSRMTGNWRSPASKHFLVSPPAQRGDYLSASFLKSGSEYAQQPGRRRRPMSTHLTARQPLDAHEERQVRKLAHSVHAPADWILHARMVTRSWDGLRTRQIAEALGCHPQTVRDHLLSTSAESMD